MEYLTVRGVEMPRIGLGTWPMKGEACTRAVSRALELGYRHLDTAEIYRNERAVGRAIRESGVARDGVFVTTKVWSNHLRDAELIRACESSLERLGTDWIDLYLIHSASRTVPIAESIGAMNALQDRGWVRHIGVSNFSVSQMKAAQAASEFPILTNQVEYHPYEQPRHVLDYCQSHDISLTAYSPLGQGRVLRDAGLHAMAKRQGKTPAQVALRWLIQQPGVLAIPKAASEAHQRENLEIFDFELTNQEMGRITQASS
jgi:diketogulonate reductase-like aldo/keto reductase